MEALLWLIPIAIAMGAFGLGGFFWSMRHGQFEDTDGDASRIFMDDTDSPIVDDSMKSDSIKKDARD